MCGIVGAFHPQNQPSLNIQGMVSRIAHRGPDAQKIIRLEYASIGVNRLAITSPENGSQPVYCPTGRWLVSLNGEIYNYQTLSREATANGFPPTTDSDSAVIAALLCFLPLQQVLLRLRGMFALALVDTKQQELWLIRDRMGVKPLYWAHSNDKTLYWSSEIGGIKTQKGVGTELFDPAIQHFLLFEYIPAPWTIYSGIHKLQAGQLLHYANGNTSLRQWWAPPTISNDIQKDTQPWEKAFYHALLDATRIRAKPDVPLGVLLSGGIDSATISALGKIHNESIHAFSCTVGEKGFNEQTNAQQVANHLGIPSKSVLFDQNAFLRYFHKIGQHMDEPLGDGSLLPTLQLMDHVKSNGYKCVLSGDGADESLAGYPTYNAHRLATLGKMARPLLHSLIHRIPVSQRGVSFEYKAKRFFEGLHYPWWKRNQIWMGAWLPDEINAQEPVWEIGKTWADRAKHGTIGQALYLDQRMYLSECVLVKVDRASMAYGVEVRSPFMDHRLVELIAQMPINVKIDFFQNKKILRAVMKQHLPKTILRQPKKGFGAPIGLWINQLPANIRSDLPSLVEPWIPPDTLQKAFADHDSKTVNNRRKLWTAICLGEWLKHQRA